MNFKYEYVPLLSKFLSSDITISNPNSPSIPNNCALTNSVIKITIGSPHNKYGYFGVKCRVKIFTFVF